MYIELLEVYIFVLSVLLHMNILLQMNASSRMHYMGESKNPFCLYGKCLLTSFVLTFASALQEQYWAEVNLRETSLSESGEEGCIFLFWLPLLYLTFSWNIGNSQGPVFPHLSNDRSWSFWVKTLKCLYRRELNTIIFFPWPLRNLTLIQFRQSSMINTGTKCIFANWG